MTTPGNDRHFLAIDLGATNTKYGVVRRDGVLVSQSVAPTPAAAGREALLSHLKQVARAAIEQARQAEVAPVALGIATAGWVNPHTGAVAYATENLPGWTGAPVADELRPIAGVPVAVENDANALAVAEKYFGAARDAEDFVCVTLGTGVGGGCYIGGRLHRGPHFFANAIGHVTLVADGLPCTCGRKGCLEVYANAAALARYDGGGRGAEDVIRAANEGDATAREAIRMYAHYLGAGLAGIVHLLDSPLIILAGGLTQDNLLLLDELRAELSREVTAWPQRRIELRYSDLGYFAGVLGAAAVAIETIER
ncbi:MAG: ROK family protein [Bryobacteraceae bacterium]|nr:ROK family protein [Bryobacteraceae bacterium]